MSVRNLHLTWHGPHDGAVAVYEDDRQLVRGIDYAQDGDEFFITTERPGAVSLRLIVVPRTQRERFIQSDIGRRTQPLDLKDEEQ